MSDLATARVAAPGVARSLSLERLARLAAVAVAGSWVGYFLFTGMPQLTLEVFPRTIVLHILLGVLAAAYVLWLAFARRLPGGTPLDFAVLGVVAAFAIATYTSVNWRVSLEATLQLGAAMIVFYAFSELPWLSAMRLTRAFMLIGAALALYALWVVGGDYADYLRLTRSVEGLSVHNIFPPTVPRVHDVSDHTNVLAMLLVLAMPFFTLSALRPNHALERAAAIAALAVGAMALFLTLSRGGWAGAAFGIIFTIAGVWATLRIDARERAGAPVRWRDVVPDALSPTAIAAIAGAIALVVIGVLGFLARTSTRPGWLFRSSLSPREDAWEAGWHIFRDHILTGAGPNAFGLLYGQYSGEFPVHTQHAHNGFLQLADDAGVLGLLALVGVVAAGTYMLWVAWRRGALEQRLLAVACSGALLGYALHNLVDAGNDWKAPAIALAVVGALIARNYMEAAPPPAAESWRERMNARGIPRIVTGVVLLALLVVPFAAWYRIDSAHHDYWLATEHWNDRFDADHPQARTDALNEMQSAVNADSSFAVYQLQLGQIQATTFIETGEREPGLLDAAIVHLQRAVALDPRSDIAHADLARAYAYAGQTGAAATEAAKTRVIARTHVEPVLMAGEVYEQIGRSSDAIDTYGQAISMNAALAGTDFFQQTDFRRANFNAVLAASALGVNQCTHGAYLVAAHRTDASAPLTGLDADSTGCSGLVFAAPDDLVQRVAFAKILMEQGRTDEAFTHLDAAVQRQPDFGPARTELGRWYAAKGQIDQARRQWVIGGQLDDPEALLLLGQSYPAGHVPGDVASQLRSLVSAGGAAQQVDLISILYYRMKYGRLSPLEPMIPGDWQRAEPRLYGEIRAALKEWQPDAPEIPR